MAGTATRQAVKNAAAAAKEPEGGASEETSDKLYMARREGSRRVKLHDQNQRKATSISEAVVVKGDNTPDMRFAENRNAFELDTSKRINGEPDRRFVENRPDLLKVHRSRGENNPNMIFTEDMVPETAGA
jgi:hypothetical protein